MNTPILSVALLAFAASLLSPAPSPGPAAAQELQFPQASPPCTLEQRIGLTDVVVVYGRPGVKGRKIFGGLEPYGQVWRTGANAATTVSFSTGVKFGGADVPAGTYTLFSIPGEQEWTVILDKKVGQWGNYSYDAKNELARVKVKPIALAEPVETLTIGLGDLRDDSATFYFEWEKVRVPVKLEVDVVKLLVPQIEQAMAGTGDKPYFPAAMFYYDHDLDLTKAAAWIEEAIKQQPDGFWVVYRKGLILAKKGDKAGALAA